MALLKPFVEQFVTTDDGENLLLAAEASSGLGVGRSFCRDGRQAGSKSPCWSPGAVCSSHTRLGPSRRSPLGRVPTTRQGLAFSGGSRARSQLAWGRGRGRQGWWESRGLVRGGEGGSQTQARVGHGAGWQWRCSGPGPGVGEAPAGPGGVGERQAF